MPSPVYIICSESGSIDSETQKVSIVNVVESIQITRVTDLPQGAMSVHRAIMQLRVISVWMKDATDKEDDVFQSQFVLNFPQHPAEIVISEVLEFSFSKPLWRTVIQNLFVPGFFGPGTFRLENRIRLKGRTEWTLRQSYPIILIEEAVSTKTPTPEKQNGGTPSPSND